METVRAHREVEYWQRDLPTSAGRVLLIRALERLCAERYGHDLATVALTFDEDGRIFLDEADMSRIMGASRLLGRAFAAGEIGTFARAFGGGTPEPLPATGWELDDFSPRFASSAVDPTAPFDAGAVPTHWVFVDEKDLERFLASDCSLDPTMGAPASNPSDGVGTVTVTAARGSDRHVRMPELESLTGLSRATIYRRIASGRFPRKIPLDDGASVWREGDVVEWLANPR